MIACGGVGESRVGGRRRSFTAFVTLIHGVSRRPDKISLDLSVKPAMRLDRRVVLSTAQLAALSILPLDRPAFAAEPLRARLSAPLLSAPPVTPDPSDPPLPAWLEGRWEATPVSYTHLTLPTKRIV